MKILPKEFSAQKIARKSRTIFLFQNPRGF
jgi:hypothetical protein